MGEYVSQALGRWFDRRAWSAFLGGNTTLCDEYQELSILAHKGYLSDELARAELSCDPEDDFGSPGHAP